MAIVITSGSTYFTMNGIEYARIYQPLKQGNNEVGIYNIYDVKQQLKNSTHYSEYTIDGSTYGSQAAVISALLPVIYAPNVGSGGAGVWGEITGTITSQTDLVNYVTANDDNDYTTSASFNTSNGIITYNRLSGGTYTVDIDGRFLLESDFNSYTATTNGLENVVEDLTPQLGGSLDLNSFSITGTGDINITGQLTLDDDGTDSGTINLGSTGAATINYDSFAGGTLGITSDDKITLSALGSKILTLDSVGIGISSVNGSTSTRGYFITSNLTTQRYWYMPDGTGNIILDASSDGNTYGRKDGAWASINASTLDGGDLGSDVKPYVTATGANSTYKVVFANTFNNTSGNYDLCIADDSGLYYNPNTSALYASVIRGTSFGGVFIANNKASFGTHYTGNDVWIFGTSGEDILLGGGISSTQNDVIIGNGYLSIGTINAASTDTDKFLVSDGGIVKYRTGSQVLSDIGGAASAAIKDWLRADIADIKTNGSLTFNDNVPISFGTSGAESEITSDGTDSVWNLYSGDLKIKDSGTTRVTIGRSSGDLTATGVIYGTDGTRKEIEDYAGTSKTIASTDAYKVIRTTSTNTVTITVNVGSLSNIGDTAEIDQMGSGTVIISTGGTATLRVSYSKLLESWGQYSRIYIQKMTSSEYRVFGELRPDAGVPTIPTNLASAFVCQTTFTLSWSASTDDVAVTGYKVYKNGSLYSDVGNVLSANITSQTAGATNDWSVSAYDAADNESAQSTALSVSQSPTVNSILMNSTGETSRLDACSALMNTTRYITGVNSTPTAGDIIYTNACATVLFDGGGDYYSDNTYSFIVDSNGEVSSVVSC